MAYKIRKFSSLEEALSYAIEQLGDEALEKATEMSSSYIRKCSDEDSPQRLPFHIALKIDTECIKQDKGAPLMIYYEHELEKEMECDKVIYNDLDSIFKCLRQISSLPDGFEHSMFTP